MSPSAPPGVEVFTVSLPDDTFPRTLVLSGKIEFTVTNETINATTYNITVTTPEEPIEEVSLAYIFFFFFFGHKINV